MNTPEFSFTANKRYSRLSPRANVYSGCSSSAYGFYGIGFCELFEGVIAAAEWGAKYVAFDSELDISFKTIV